jgi:hypothetical protein
LVATSAQPTGGNSSISMIPSSSPSEWGKKSAQNTSPPDCRAAKRQPLRATWVCTPVWWPLLDV